MLTSSHQLIQCQRFFTTMTLLLLHWRRLCFVEKQQKEGRRDRVNWCNYWGRGRFCTRESFLSIQENIWLMIRSVFVCSLINEIALPHWMSKNSFPSYANASPQNWHDVMTYFISSLIVNSATSNITVLPHNFLAHCFSGFIDVRCYLIHISFQHCLRIWFGMPRITSEFLPLDPS